jgi:hypothetical protein
MHASKNVTVYLHCSSRPIIEDCEGVRFAPLPEIFEKILMGKGVEEGVKRDEGKLGQNRWDQIDDFGWLKMEPSPHFRILGEEERVREEVWRDVLAVKEGGSVEEVLRKVGIVSGSDEDEL